MTPNISKTLVNVKNFTSEPFTMQTTDKPYSEVWLGITGSGPVYVDVFCSDNVWRTYPELTFTADTAQLITIKSGKFRIRVGATATTVEICA